MNNWKLYAYAFTGAGALIIASVTSTACTTTTTSSTGTGGSGGSDQGNAGTTGTAGSSAAGSSGAAGAGGGAGAGGAGGAGGGMTTSGDALVTALGLDTMGSAACKACVNGMTGMTADGMTDCSKISGVCDTDTMSPPCSGLIACIAEQKQMKPMDNVNCFFEACSATAPSVEGNHLAICVAEKCGSMCGNIVQGFTCPAGM